MTVVDVVLIACGMGVLIGSVGLIRFGERRNIEYARLHIAGVVDVACIIAMASMGYYLIALSYLLLAPIVAHAVANTRYHREVEA
ncbi:MAG: cation:proton antiporter [Candidatus Altiarchaeota archaeon]